MYSAGRSSIAAAMARTISTWPQSITSPAVAAPARNSVSSTTKGTAIAAFISQIARHECRRRRIHTVIAATMSRSITTAPTSGRPSAASTPSAAPAQSQAGPSSSIPSTITTTISARCARNLPTVRALVTGVAWWWVAVRTAVSPVPSPWP